MPNKNRKNPTENVEESGEDENEDEPAEETETEEVKAEEDSEEKTEETVEITENLSDEEKALVEIIKKAPVDIDALIDKSGLDYETAIDTLTVLELSKVIERQMDGNYALYKQK